MKIERKTAEIRQPQESAEALSIDADPMEVFLRWRGDEPEGALPCVLATADAEGRPSARLVDIAWVDEGLVFFTTEGSRKIRDLKDRPGEACFGWLDRRRQVRVRGHATRLDALASDEHFSSLPRGVQLLSWASDQRSEIAMPTETSDRLEALARKYAGQEVPRPDRWSGYRLTPDRFEFWQGQDFGFPTRVVSELVADAWRTRWVTP